MKNLISDFFIFYGQLVFIFIFFVLMLFMKINERFNFNIDPYSLQKAIGTVILVWGIYSILSLAMLLYNLFMS